MGKGNVGDRILVVDEDSGDGAYTNGHKGTICLVEEGFKGAHVDFDHLEKVRDGEYLYAEEYEIIQKASSATEEVIPWAVGQEVWDTVFGKGKVDRIFDGMQIQVEYEDMKRWYTPGGILQTLGAAKHRSLFFSEPQIIAETMPPKKPFVPVLKKGDIIVLQTKVEEFAPESYVLIVEHETEDEIYCLEDASYTKAYWTVHKLGDKVEFNV